MLYLVIFLIIQAIGMAWAWYKVARELTDNPWWWRLALMIFWPITCLLQGVNVQ